VKISLDRNSIPTNFLKSEFEKGNITQKEYEGTAFIREKGNFDVKNPDYLS